MSQDQGRSVAFPEFEDDSTRIVGEVQLRNYGHFMEEYAAQLREIEDALDDTIGETWDVTLDPIALQASPYEQSSILEVIHTDNKIFNKVMTVLSALCCEIDMLKHEAETRFYPAVMFYGEGAEQDSSNDGEAQVLMGRMLATFQDLDCFVLRCYDVIRNTIQQLSALHTDNKSRTSGLDVNQVHFLPMYEHLAELLKVLITLDEIFTNQTVLKEHWTLYKRMLKSVHHNPAKFGFTEESLRPFEKLIMRLEQHLMEGYIYSNCVDSSFDNPQKGCFVHKNSVFADELQCVVKAMFSGTESVIGEANETDQRHKFVGLCGLYVLYMRIYQGTDKKLFKQMWDSYKKLPGIHLVGNIIWFATDFLTDHLAPMVNALDKKAKLIVAQYRNQWLTTKMGNLTRDLQTLTIKAGAWMVQMESDFQRKGTILENLEHRCFLFRQGLHIARTLSHTVKTLMNMHVALNKAMTKTVVLQLCKLTELLKAIEGTFHRRSMLVSQSINHIVQQLSFLALSALSTAKRRIVSDKRYTDKRLDVLSAIVLAETALNGPGTKERRLIVSMALCMATRMRSFKDDELSQLAAMLKKLGDVSSLQDILKSVCDTGFMYWHRVIFPIYVASAYEKAVDVYRLRYMFTALNDCMLPLKRTKHMEDPQKLLEQFNKDITGDFYTNLVEPLCRDIETDLRLDIHHHEYKLDDRNPFTVGQKDLMVFLKMRPVKFFGRFINVKTEVEHYLDRTFYNLTTVALHDWKKYSAMKNLATQKYGLSLMESHLPSQTLEQGLDVLEIMRNIQVFVSRYTYNLNNQIFIERTSNNKHLNTINIRHVANSIRTHGTGIMSTTVNFTYQFLKQKFFVFSQFLYDEHIKSKLIKDLRFFKETHSGTDQKYPYERADKFNKGIRKLGVSADGLSYLDRFRLLITQIGNAMGYIRMIRSGGLHCCSNAIRFIPDLDDIINFEESCKQETLPECTQSAARNLDRVVESMVKNFSEGTEYFKMLVNVFAPEFRNQRHMHLKNFFMIVPPLTVNFVENSINCKEKMTKKNKQDAAFTDDGFAMGMAYILKLLDQYQDFDTLHWFQSVQQKYVSELETIKKQASTGSNDEKLTQTVSLTTKRLQTYQQEFILLYYSLSSARIFFRADKTAQEEQEETKESTKAAEVSKTPVEHSENDAALSDQVTGSSQQAPPPPQAPGDIPPPPPPPPSW